MILGNIFLIGGYMIDLINTLNNTTNLMEINNLIKDLSKKDLKVVAAHLQIPLLSKDNRDDIHTRIMTYFKYSNYGTAFKNYLEK
jgi:glyceraldehyde-3-phosphate dehydrogenase/erythrose-4-phosphate dehydrogenase